VARRSASVRGRAGEAVFLEEARYAGAQEIASISFPVEQRRVSRWAIAALRIGTRRLTVAHSGANSVERHETPLDAGYPRPPISESPPDRESLGMGLKERTGGENRFILNTMFRRGSRRGGKEAATKEQQLLYFDFAAGFAFFETTRSPLSAASPVFGVERENAIKRRSRGAFTCLVPVNPAGRSARCPVSRQMAVDASLRVAEFYGWRMAVWWFTSTVSEIH